MIKKLGTIFIILILSLVFVSCDDGTIDSGTPAITLTGKIDFSDSEVSSLTSGDTINFGKVALATSALMTFTITNNGTSTLNLTDTESGVVQITGTNGDQFSITQPEAETIAAGANTTFSISFSPTSGGTKTAAISITSNDSTESSYNLLLTGVGGFPDIAMTGKINFSDPGVSTLTSGATIDFENVSQGTPKEMSFTIKNTGDSELTISSIIISDDTDGIYNIPTAPLPASIPAGSENEFIIRFTSNNSSEKTAKATIESDDPDEASFQLLLTGYASS